MLFYGTLNELFYEHQLKKKLLPFENMATVTTIVHI